MTKSICIIGFLVLVPFVLSAQQNKESTKETKLSPRWNVNISPMALFDYSPRYRVGVEYFSHNNWSYALDLGYGNTSLTHSHAYGMEWANDYELFEFRPEVKYYFAKFAKIHHYVALELFHINATDVFYDDYYYPEGQQYLNSVGYVRADYQYMKTGLDIKYGLKWYLLDRLFLEGYVGLGAAQREHDYKNVNVLNLPYDIPSVLYGEEYLHEGKKILMHFSLAFKIGFVFY